VLESVARANELDPLNTELADWGTWALFMVGELEAARTWAQRQMREHPDNGFVFCGAGISAYLSGDTAEGVALLEQGVKLTDRAPVALIMLAQGFGYAGHTEKVRPLLAEAEAARVYMCPYETAVAYLTLGDDASKAQSDGAARGRRGETVELPHLPARTTIPTTSCAHRSSTTRCSRAGTRRTTRPPCFTSNSSPARK
jgi:hypothetical protein